MITHDELHSLDLKALAERLAHIRTTRTAQGWATDDAVTKSSLERRILEIVCGGERSDATPIDVEYDIALEVQGKKFEAESAGIRPGGLLLPGRLVIKDGSAATLTIRTENNYPLKVKCIIRNREEEGIAIAFESHDAATQRRVERFILELLKSREE